MLSSTNKPRTLFSSSPHLLNSLAWRWKPNRDVKLHSSYCWPLAFLMVLVFNVTDSHAYSYLHMACRNKVSLHEEVHYPGFSAGSSQTLRICLCVFWWNNCGLWEQVPVCAHVWRQRLQQAGVCSGGGACIRLCLWELCGCVSAVCRGTLSQSCLWGEKKETWSPSACLCLH